MPASPSQRKIAVATNSGPLSDRRCRGAPCTLTSWASTSITRPERMPPATSIARHSRVHSSTIVRHLSVCRFAQVSNTKSYAHTWFRAVGGSGRGRPVATRRARLRAKAMADLRLSIGREAGTPLLCFSFRGDPGWR